MWTGVRKVLRVRTPQSAGQGGSSTLVFWHNEPGQQSPVAPGAAPGGASAPAPAPRPPATPPVVPQRCFQCQPCLCGNCRQALARLRSQGARGQHAASQFENCAGCSTNSSQSCIGKSACLTWNEEETALYNRMIQHKALAFRAQNLGATRALGPEPQPVLRPEVHLAGVPDNIPLPEEDEPPAGSTGDNLLENTGEEVGAQGGMVEGLPSPLPPPQSPPSADQIMAQMVTT